MTGSRRSTSAHRAKNRVRMQSVNIRDSVYERLMSLGPFDPSLPTARNVFEHSPGNQATDVDMARTRSVLVLSLPSAIESHWRVPELWYWVLDHGVLNCKLHQWSSLIDALLDITRCLQGAGGVREVRSPRRKEPYGLCIKHATKLLIAGGSVFFTFLHYLLLFIHSLQDSYHKNVAASYTTDSACQHFTLHHHRSLCFRSYQPIWMDRNFRQL